MFHSEGLDAAAGNSGEEPPGEVQPQPGTRGNPRCGLVLAGKGIELLHPARSVARGVDASAVPRHFRRKFERAETQQGFEPGAQRAQLLGGNIGVQRLRQTLSVCELDGGPQLETGREKLILDPQPQTVRSEDAVAGILHRSGHTALHDLVEHALPIGDALPAEFAAQGMRAAAQAQPGRKERAAVAVPDGLPLSGPALETGKADIGVEFRGALAQAGLEGGAKRILAQRQAADEGDPKVKDF